MFPVISTTSSIYDIKIIYLAENLAFYTNNITF